MIRRLALAAGCIALSTIAISGKAHAQTVDVDASGTVPSSCSTSNVTAGVMGVYSQYRLATDAPGGSHGSFNLTCTGGAQLSASVPIPQNDLSSNVDWYGGGILGITGWTQKGGSASTGSISGPISNRLIQVLVAADNRGTAPLASGTYSYKTTVTITPQ